MPTKISRAVKGALYKNYCGMLGKKWPLALSSRYKGERKWIYFVFMGHPSTLFYVQGRGCRTAIVVFQQRVYNGLDSHLFAKLCHRLVRHSLN